MSGQDPRKVSRAAAARRIELAAEFGRAGRPAEAEKICREVLGVDPVCFDALHLLALLRHQAGQSSEALELIDQALRANRRSADALANRATILLQLGRADEALATCERALKLAPRHLYALSNRGSAQRALGRDADALATFEKLLALDPGSAATWSNHGTRLRAQASSARLRSIPTMPSCGSTTVSCGSPWAISPADGSSTNSVGRGRRTRGRRCGRNGRGPSRWPARRSCSTPSRGSATRFNSSATSHGWRGRPIGCGSRSTTASRPSSCRSPTT